MSDLTAEQLRERLAERKRLNLNESRTLIHLLDATAAELAAAYRRIPDPDALTPPFEHALLQPVPPEIRTAVLDEQRRLYLQASELLLAQLATLTTELARLHAVVAATNDPAPPAPALDLPPDLPPTLHTALLQVQAHPDLHHPERHAGAIYAWCLEWLKLRAELHAVAPAVPASQEHM
ncbi:MAG: hypothetical protein HC911_10645 [Chloroflexaceae bacterium]|nr:hypothetical protein [Chloroflexaceae bacterium]